jgi:hypothetical protein
VIIKNQAIIGLIFYYAFCLYNNTAELYFCCGRCGFSGLKHFEPKFRLQQIEVTGWC